MESAAIRVKATTDNVAGVKLPRFECEGGADASHRSDLTGLGRGGQQVQSCRKAYLQAATLMVKLASLQTSFLTLDEAIKTTNRR